MWNFMRYRIELAESLHLESVGAVPERVESSHAYAWMKELMLSTARNN